MTAPAPTPTAPAPPPPAPSPTTPAPPAPSSDDTTSAAVDEAAAKAAKDGKPELTRAEVNAIVQRRLAEEKTKHDRELEAVRAEAGKSGTELAEAQRDAARKAAEDATTGAARSIAEAHIEAALARSGARADRINAVAGLMAAQLDAIAKADDPRSAAAAAVDVAKDSYPEFWTAKATTAAASGGELGGQHAGAVTVEQFLNMDYTARTELFSKDPDNYRRLRDAAADSAPI